MHLKSLYLWELILGTVHVHVVANSCENVWPFLDEANLSVFYWLFTCRYISIAVRDLER